MWLKGDYTGVRKERQKQALKERCDLVLSFHFNAFNNPHAGGAEVYHNGKANAAAIAEALLKAIVTVTGVRARRIASAYGTRAAFITAYACPAVLLEPCFLTNPDEAALLHDERVLRHLGETIASTIAPFTRRFGIDIGHKFKTSSPHDKGARCVLGDYEADHAEQLAKVVAASLQLRTKEVVMR